MMMHGVAANNTTTTTTTTTTSQNTPVGNTNNNNNSTNANVQNNKSSSNSHKSGINMQDIAASPRGDYNRQENFGIKLKDTNSVMYSEQQQRKLEMLESRFVPLNPQKSVSQDFSNQSLSSDEPKADLHLSIDHSNTPEKNNFNLINNNNSATIVNQPQQYTNNNINNNNNINPNINNNNNNNNNNTISV